LEKVFLTSTGAAKTPSPVGPDVVNFKKLEYKIEGSRVKYFVEAVGSGFHKWSYSGKFRARAGKHTISHGCIRLKESDAIWMFKNIEEGTRVLIY
jgi:lipoprotein-anchoring transpeptidase ErfK/SrfK